MAAKTAMFDGPRGIAVDDAGNVYVSEYSNERVQVFDANGSFLAKWGNPTAGEFRYPSGIDVDDAGRLFITDTSNNMIWVYTVDGVLLTQFSGSGSRHLATPFGVVIDSAGNVYVAERDSHRVQIFAPVLLAPGGAGIPTDTDGDGMCDDVNGNERKDFADVVLYFNQMTWIAANEPMAAFDYNGNGRIDFADVVWLFNHL